MRTRGPDAEPAPPRAGREPLARQHLLVPAAFVAHCAEELPAFPAWATRHFGTTTTRFYLASHAVLVPAVLYAGYRGARDDARGGWTDVSLAVSAGFACNAAFHGVTTVGFREYSPGLVTGGTLVLPAALRVLRSARRDPRVGPARVRRAVAAGAAVHALVVASLYVDMPRLA